MQKRIESILKEIAKEKNIPFEVIKAVYESQSMFTRMCMSKGEKGNIDSYLNIRWRNLGSWIVKPGRLAIIHKNGINSKSKESI